MQGNAFLSIVIANYNYGRFLEEAITSVTRQCGAAVRCEDGVWRLPLEDGVSVELIICDAASKDESVEVIRWHEQELAWWCSEPDGGQSAAFNKGFSHATGRFLTWLNADDMMLAGSLKMLLEASRRWPDQEWFAGGSVHFGPDERIILCTNTRRFSEYEAAHGQIAVYSPSSFFTRRLFEAVGKFDESFRYSMDTHLWSKFYTLEGVRFKILPGYVFGFRYHADSKTTCVHFETEKSADEIQKNREQGQNEREKICALFPICKPMTRVGRWLRMDWRAKAKSMWDTMRYKGKSLWCCGFLGVDDGE